MVPRALHLLTVLTSSQQISIQPPHFSRACVFVADQRRLVLVVPPSVASISGIITVPKCK